MGFSEEELPFSRRMDMTLLILATAFTLATFVVLHNRAKNLAYQPVRIRRTKRH